MTITVSEDILQATHMTEDEIMRELAVALFAQERLTLGQASDLARMSQLEFQRLLASREIAVHYGVEEYEEDLQNLRELGLLT